MDHLTFEKGGGGVIWYRQEVLFQPLRAQGNLFYGRVYAVYHTFFASITERA